MRTPEQIYKKYKSFATAVTKDEFLKVVDTIQNEAYTKGYNDGYDDFSECPNFNKVMSND